MAFRDKNKKKKQNQEGNIVALTSWIGSPTSLTLHSAVFLSAFFVSILGFVEWPLMLLILTTAVSLEAIYLAIFIQMSVNRSVESLKEVEEEIEELGEDVEEIQEDVEDIQEDIEELGEEEEEDEKLQEKQTLTLERLMQDVRNILTELEEFKKVEDSKDKDSTSL